MLVGTIIEEMWKPIFFKKIHCSRQKLFFCLVKNNIVHLSDISGCEKRFSSFQLVEKDFLFSGNRILSFRVLLKFLKFKGSNFFEEKPYFCSWKLIFWLNFFFIFQILLLVKAIFCLAKTYFYTNFLFRLVGTDFLFCGNFFF